MRRFLMIAVLVLVGSLALQAQAVNPTTPGNFNSDSFQTLGTILNLTAIQPAKCTTIVAGACTVTTPPSWASQFAFNGCLVSVETNSVRMGWSSANTTATKGLLLPVGVYWIGGRQNMLGMFFISTSAAGSTLNLACTRN